MKLYSHFQCMVQPGKKMGLMLVLIFGSVENMVSYLDRDGENEKNINRLSAAILDFLFSFTPYQG